MNEDDAFDKELRGIDWEIIHERQAARGDLTPHVCNLLGVKSGDHILELGSGPGYMSVQLASVVAPGKVYAVDKHPDALRYLQDKVKQNTEDIHPITADVKALPLYLSQPIPTLAAFLLHHVGKPKETIDTIASVLPSESPFLVVEYHPEAVGDVGPPLEHRLAPAQVRGWLLDCGFDLENSDTLPGEKYTLLSRR